MLFPQGLVVVVAESRRTSQYLAHYELRYGALPLDDVLAALSTADPNDAQAELFPHGMRIL